MTSHPAFHEGFLTTEEVSDAFSVRVARSLIRPRRQLDVREVTCAQGAPAA